MRKFFKTLWRVITFPFVLVFKIIVFPFRAIPRFIHFLNTDPEDHPVMDVFASVISDADTREVFWNEFEIFRKHLLRAVIGIALGIAISFNYAIPLMEYLAGPVGGLDKLQAIHPTEEIGVFMRVALMSGIAISLPYIAFELWLFAAPGLKSREKKFGLFGIPLASLLFIGGMAFTFYVLMPTALQFLGNFTSIRQFWTASEYFGFVTGFMLWIGLFFEFPLVIYVLTSIGMVKPQILLQQWRLAIVIISIIAAVVTPTIDPITMGLTMLPMIALYFGSIALSYIAYAGRRNRNEEISENIESV